VRFFSLERQAMLSRWDNSCLENNVNTIMTRYAIVSAYINNQTDEAWAEMKEAIAKVDGLPKVTIWRDGSRSNGRSNGATEVELRDV